jgi:16S rRNA (adenine1518-N6/adenine1519-N6)-dimethyltransferase
VSSRKSLGQHFLHDRSVVSRICSTARLDPGDTVVEIGPGLGILTEALAEHVAHVIAIEKDPLLAGQLPGWLPNNVDVRTADALEFDVGKLPEDGYKLVSNLPYNVATAILRALLDSTNRPESCTFMVQREVAERMVARPNKMNVLAVAMQFHGSPRIAFHVGRGAFTPPPGVASSVVHMPTKPADGVVGDDYEGFFELVRAGFSARRKTLRNSLIVGGLGADRVDQILSGADIRPDVRPQQLDVPDWLAMYRASRAIGA